jgi:hypothetical protein
MSNMFNYFRQKRVYPVLEAPTHCGVCGRVFLGSLSLAFYEMLQFNTVKVESSYRKWVNKSKK